MRTSLLPAYGLAAALMLVLALAACDGGDGGSGGADSHVDFYWVSIGETNPPTSPDQRVVQESGIQLLGSAECDNCPPDELSCPADHPPQPSTINVTWTNRTTGETGIPFFNGIVGSCICIPLFPCYVSYSHRWYTHQYEVGLAYGENLIEVMASGPSKAPGTDSIMITRIPGTVGNPKATSGKQQVTLSWDPVPDATSYNIYWSTSRDVSKSTGTMIPGVNSPYTHTGLVDGQTYYYIVTAVVLGVEGESSSTVAATPGWVVESAATTTGRTITSIATDSAGNAHIHYANVASTGTAYSFQSYYATNVSGAWSSLLIDQSVGSYGPDDIDVDIGLDSQNTVHVSVVNSSGLTHAIYASGTWLREVVDPSARDEATLVLDAANTAHIAYFASTSLRYATNTSGAWTNIVIEEFGGIPLSLVSLSVDAAGATHIAYAGINNILKYATNQGGVWTVSSLGQPVNSDSSLAVDPGGAVHFVYSNQYANNVSGTWTVETIQDSSLYNPSLSLDTAGKAHLIGAGVFPSALLYASNSSGTWRIATLESGNYPPVNPGDMDIALDSQRKAHITYPMTNRLRYATNR